MPTVVGEAVHQSLTLACALGYGEKFVPSLVEAQEQLTGAKIVPRQAATPLLPNSGDGGVKPT